jgi:hypothetical protein
MKNATVTPHCEGACLKFQIRSSDSPLIERVWTSQSERAGVFSSIAASNVEMVVTHLQGKASLTMRGPETKATLAECPGDGEWMGIRFALGTYLPTLLPATIADRKDVTLPGVSGTFHLSGSDWEFPSFENAEVFVKRLAHAGILVRDQTVDSVLNGSRREPRTRSLRSEQRHFLKATGLTRNTFRQIERARYAAVLLRLGATIADTVFKAGYFDQAHLTRSLKHLTGHTPAKIMSHDVQLSLLYNTSAPEWLYDSERDFGARNGE